MKLLCALVMGILALSACSGSAVITSVEREQPSTESDSVASATQAPAIEATDATQESLLPLDDAEAVEPNLDDRSSTGDPIAPLPADSTAPVAPLPDAESVDSATTDVDAAPEAVEPETESQDQGPTEVAATADDIPATTEEAAASVDGEATAEPATVATSADWCSGPAEHIHDAFLDLMWGERLGEVTLEQALVGMLDALIEVQPSAPAELEQVLIDAIESQTDVNASLAAVGWDRSVVDWNTVVGLDLQETSTTAIDEYNARVCGLELAFVLPDDDLFDEDAQEPAESVVQNPPVDTSVKDPFDLGEYGIDLDSFDLENEDELKRLLAEFLVQSLVADEGFSEEEARCMTSVLVENDFTSSDEARAQVLDCGIPLDRLTDIAGG